MQVVLNLSEAEVNVVLAGVAKLPFEVAAPVFTKIQAEAIKQLSEKETVEEPGE